METNEKKSPDVVVDMEEQATNKQHIITTLAKYGISVKSIAATVGPTITLHQVVLGDDSQIAQIQKLKDEIARSLAAVGIRVTRIIAPMPDKELAGIEMLNKDVSVDDLEKVGIVSPAQGIKPREVYIQDDASFVFLK